MPDPVIHLLTPGGDLRQVTAFCRDRRPERGTWQRAHTALWRPGDLDQVVEALR